MKPVKPGTVLNSKGNITLTNQVNHNDSSTRTYAHTRGKMIIWQNWPNRIKNLAESPEFQQVITTYAVSGDEYSAWSAVICTDVINGIGGQFKNPADMGFSMPVLVGMSNIFKLLANNGRRALILTEQEWLCEALIVGSSIQVARTEREMLAELRKMAKDVDYLMHPISPSDNYPARSMSRRKDLPITLQWAAFPQKKFDLSSLPY